jgi:hypothetical protein
MNIELVKDYYGKTLRGSDDLKTKACCPPRPLEITDPEVEEKIGAARVYSATYDCSRSTGSRPPARTTDRPSFTGAAFRTRYMCSRSTATTPSKRDG